MTIPAIPPAGGGRLTRLRGLSDTAVAWLFISPPFNTRMVPTTVKAGIAAALALPAAQHITNPVLPNETGAFITALVVQALVGFTLGMFTLLLVNALQAAGQFVDLFAGFSLSTIFPSLSKAGTSPSRRCQPP